MDEKNNTGSHAELITTPARLEAVCALLLKAEAVAVDTEFFWETTFYPILGLVQLAVQDGSCWLVDPLSIKDLRALGPVMASPSVTKVLHDAPQDLGILARATGSIPRSIFDTRIASGFAGHGATTSLQTVLRDVLGIDLAKEETRSNWLQRPLRPNQLRYAADDVLHLLTLRDRLQAACANDTVRGWLSEEMKRLDDPAFFQDRDPRLMYLRVKGSLRLSAGELAVLREVAAWREEEARKRDWPRGHVLPDRLLVTLARSKPRNTEDLARIEDMPRTMPADVMANLLEAISRGLAVPAAECPRPAGEGITSTVKNRATRILAQLSSACAPYNIDPTLVAARTELETFLNLQDQGTAADHPFVTGWRRTFFDEWIMTGESQLRLFT
jgi:ribonuclease D